MRRSSITVGVLLGALVATNAFWAYRVIDAGVSATYRDVSLNDAQIALRQSLALLITSGVHISPRSQVIQLAQDAGGGGTPFEKEGYVWVGRLGLAFSANGKHKGSHLSGRQVMVAAVNPLLVPTPCGLGTALR